MIRKVKFSLKYKFVAAISILLLMTMGFYLSYALNIFKEDKAADVYSIALTNSVSVSERTRLLVNEELVLLEKLKEGASGESIAENLQAMTKNRPELLGVECLVNEKNYLSSVNSSKLRELTNSDQNFSLDESSGGVAQLKKVSGYSTKVEMALAQGFPSHFSILSSLNPNLKCALHISYEKLFPLMSETLDYGTYILTESGKIFFKINDENTPIDADKIVTDQTIQDVQQGVKKFDESRGPVIRAFSRIPGLGLMAITEIEEQKAFMASSLLIQKSFYFGILILSVAVIVGILFTKRMTRNVQTLFEATTQVSLGNFDVNPVAEGNDEIGALTDSFIDMKDKIVGFMEEMKEKARIESELKVAQLVQNSFFPKQPMIRSTFSFDGRYLPASECSGDWWGFFEQGQKVTLIVCDATGHGVPAALITAAAHSCISTLKIDSEKNYISPSAVLERLNRVICSMHSEILMTAFVLEIDEAKGEIIYSNASHMNPYLIHRVQDEYTKEGVDPLIANNGARLGEKENSRYEETTVEVKRGDRIVMFSDGLTEMEAEGKAWGQRNFLKSILSGARKEATGMINSILEDFNNHRKGLALQDDITLVCVSFEGKRVLLDENNSDIPEGESFVISKLSNERNIEVLAKNSIRHLIGHNTIDLNREIRVMEKMEERKVFNLDDYLDETYQKHSWNLISNNRVKAVVEEMSLKLANDLSEAVRVEALKLVSEELLSNAFYHSGGDGKKIDRGEEILLTPDKEVNYSVAVNSEYIVLSVKGPSGFSSKEKIISSIQRGYQEKTPLPGNFGAGLGLYMVYENTSQIWVINGGESAGQIICVFEKFNRYKKGRERVTSFHYLAKEIQYE